MKCFQNVLLLVPCIDLFHFKTLMSVTQPRVYVTVSGESVTIHWARISVSVERGQGEMDTPVQVSWLIKTQQTVFIYIYCYALSTECLFN